MALASTSTVPISVWIGLEICSRIHALATSMALWSPFLCMALAGTCATTLEKEPLPSCCSASSFSFLSGAPLLALRRASGRLCKRACRCSATGGVLVFCFPSNVTAALPDAVSSAGPDGAAASLTSTVGIVTIFSKAPELDEERNLSSAGSFPMVEVWARRDPRPVFEDFSPSGCSEGMCCSLPKAVTGLSSDCCPDGFFLYSYPVSSQILSAPK